MLKLAASDAGKFERPDVLEFTDGDGQNRRGRVGSVETSRQFAEELQALKSRFGLPGAVDVGEEPVEAGAAGPVEQPVRQERPPQVQLLESADQPSTNIGLVRLTRRQSQPAQKEHLEEPSKPKQADQELHIRQFRRPLQRDDRHPPPQGREAAARIELHDAESGRL